MPPQPPLYIPTTEQGWNEEPPVVSQPSSNPPPSYREAVEQGCNEQPPVVSQPSTLPLLHLPTAEQGYNEEPLLMPEAWRYDASRGRVVVVTQQPGRGRQPTRPWTFGLFSCLDDCELCLCVTFCYGYAATELVKDMGENPDLPCCMCYWLTALRTKARTQLGIKGSMYEDCMLDVFCNPCALCQLQREVKVAKRNGLM